MALPPLFTKSHENYPAISGHERWDNLLDFSLKKFVPIKGLSYKQCACGTIEDRSLSWLIFRVTFLTGAIVGTGVAIFRLKNHALSQKDVNIHRVQNRFLHSLGIYGAALFLIFLRATRQHNTGRYVTEALEIAQAMKELESKVALTEEMERDIRKVENELLVPNRINNSVFTLDAYPGLIFKKNLSIENSVSPDERFFNMVVAKALCIKHNWTHLVVPSVKMVKVGRARYVVEERLDINRDSMAQESFFLNYEDRLEKAVSELRDLILLTHQSDIEYRNNSVHGDPRGTAGDLRLTLHDLELTEESGPEMGLFGDIRLSRTGLMGLLGPKLSIQLLDYVRSKHLEYNSKALSAYNQRRSEIDIEQFYQKHHITSPQSQITEGINPLRAGAHKCMQVGHGIAVEVLQAFNQISAKSLPLDPSTMVLRRARLQRLQIELINISNIDCSHCKAKVRYNPLTRQLIGRSPNDYKLEAIKAGLVILKSQDLIYDYEVWVEGSTCVMHVLA